MRIKYDGFQWDSGNTNHCIKHGVSQDEIEHVLTHMTFYIPDPYPLETRMRTAGMTKESRYVFIVFAFRKLEDELHIRPISARYMHNKEVKAYEQFKNT